MVVFELMYLSMINFLQHGVDSSETSASLNTAVKRKARKYLKTSLLSPRSRSKNFHRPDRVCARNIRTTPQSKKTINFNFGVNTTQCLSVHWVEVHVRAMLTLLSKKSHWRSYQLNFSLNCWSILALHSTHVYILGTQRHLFKSPFTVILGGSCSTMSLRSIKIVLQRRLEIWSLRKGTWLESVCWRSNSLSCLFFLCINFKPLPCGDEDWWGNLESFGHTWTFWVKILRFLIASLCAMCLKIMAHRNSS